MLWACCSPTVSGGSLHRLHRPSPRPKALVSEVKAAHCVSARRRRAHPRQASPRPARHFTQRKSVFAWNFPAREPTSTPWPGIPGRLYVLCHLQGLPPTWSFSQDTHIPPEQNESVPGQYLGVGEGWGGDFLEAASASCSLSSSHTAAPGRNYF